MSEYGYQVNNSAGRRIIDTRFRSLEAMAWGTVFVPNRGLSRIDWPECDGAIVFMRSNNQAFMFRGYPLLTGARATYCHFSADRDTYISYVVAGFRTAPSDFNPGGYGIMTRDANTRIGFHSARNYVRLPHPPLLLATQGFTASVSWTGYIASTAPVHPNFTGNTYFAWSTLPCWSNSGSVFWYLGFQHYDATYLQTLRIDMSDSYNANPTINMGYYLNTPPGNTVLPGVHLTTEFTPPA